MTCCCQCGNDVDELDAIRWSGAALVPGGLRLLCEACRETTCFCDGCGRLTQDEEALRGLDGAWRCRRCHQRHLETQDDAAAALDAWHEGGAGRWAKMGSGWDPTLQRHTGRLVLLFDLSVTGRSTAYAASGWNLRSWVEAGRAALANYHRAVDALEAERRGLGTGPHIVEAVAEALSASPGSR